MVGSSLVHKLIRKEATVTDTDGGDSVVGSDGSMVKLRKPWKRRSRTTSKLRPFPYLSGLPLHLRDPDFLAKSQLIGDLLFDVKPETTEGSLRQKADCSRPKIQPQVTLQVFGRGRGDMLQYFKIRTTRGYVRYL